MPKLKLKISALIKLAKEALLSESTKEHKKYEKAILLKYEKRR